LPPLLLIVYRMFCCIRPLWLLVAPS
jgi:hypothetical protein